MLPGFIFWQHLLVLIIWIAALCISSLAVEVVSLLCAVVSLAIAYNFFRIRQRYSGYLMFDRQSWSYCSPHLPPYPLRLVSYSILFRGIIILRFNNDAKRLHKNIEYFFTTKTLDLVTFQHIKILAETKKLIV